MKRVTELSGVELDLWVARADGIPVYECGTDSWPGNGFVHCQGFRHPVITVGLSGSVMIETDGKAKPYSPSTDWSQGGPIIEREMIELSHDRDWREDGQFGRVWQGHDAASGYYDGDTALVAAMRSFVAAKFGQEVEAPAQVSPPALNTDGGSNG